MIEATGALGYAKTPVAEVIGRAGVSRKAFYEHFPNKEQCFLEASDVITGSAIELIEMRYRAAAETGSGTEAAIAALLEQATANPEAVRLVLVELGALGADGILRRERLLALAERLLHEFLALEPTTAMPNPILRAIIGGVNQTVYATATGLRSMSSRRILADLVDWISTYQATAEAIGMLSPQVPRQALPASPGGGRAPGTLSPVVANGRRRRGAGSHGFVVHSQRERILDAIAGLSATVGYSAITVNRIGQQASVAPGTFYAHFANKEDAFLVAYEVGHSRGLSLVESSCLAAPDWPSGVRAGINALFGFLASEPIFAHLALVDAPVVSLRLAERARQGFDAYEHIFNHALESAGTSVAPLALEAIMGGLLELCLSYTLQQRVGELVSLVGPATYFALAPILGVEEAARVAAATHDG